MRNPETRLLLGAKHRALSKGLPFDITVDDLIIPEVCPLLGTPITLNGPSDTSPSLDRIRPEIGYVRGNVQVISNRANRIKNNATPQELYRMGCALLHLTTQL